MASWLMKLTFRKCGSGAECNRADRRIVAGVGVGRVGTGVVNVSGMSGSI